MPYVSGACHWFPGHHIVFMSRSSEDVTAPSTEDVAFFRLLAELEKAARTDRAKFTPKATASICERLRKLVADISVEGEGAVWHP